MTVYLDCNATSPIEPKVYEEVVRFLAVEFGNAGSRTHEFGNRAKIAVQRAREQLASVVRAKAEEVVFTSGATESNNLALLGLAVHGEQTNRKHIISTQIEHKAVLEPLECLAKRGFEVTLIPPTKGGFVEAAAVRSALRDDTLVVSIMQANNETGVLQPIHEIASVLADHAAYLHVDAAQGFGKDILTLQNQRIDLMSISGHKIYGPKGIGALVARRRGFVKVPLTPLFYGGGQERGLRPGTLPVPLVVGLGVACELAMKDSQRRAGACRAFRKTALKALRRLDFVFNGDPERSLPHVINISVLGLDSEAVMVALKDIVAISNGSACTSQSYEPSHVLKAMGLPDPQIMGALRLSWSHLTAEPDWDAVVRSVSALR